MLACILLGSYVALIFALDQPRVQQYIADTVEEQLEAKIGSRIDVEHITIGLFNAVELHNVTLYDKKGKELLHSKLIYGKIRIRPLLHGKVFLRNISILDANFNLYKETADGDINLKYIIDAFKTDKKPKKPLDLTINSLLLRRCQLVYDELYQPQPADNRFTPHHIAANDINANLSLKRLTNDDINLRIRQLSLHEQSGLTIKSLHLHLLANRKHADIRDLDLALSNSHISQKELALDYDLDDSKNFKSSIRLNGQFDDIQIATEDISHFVPALQPVDETFVVKTQLQYDNSQLVLNNLSLQNLSHSLDLVGNIRLRNDGAGKFGVSADTQRLAVQQQFLSRIFNGVLNKSMPSQLQALGNILFNGEIYYLKDSSMSGLAANSGSMKGQLTTALGLLDSDVKLDHNKVTADLTSKNLNPSLIVSHKYVPSFIDFHLNGDAELIPSSQGGMGIGKTDADITVNAVTIANQSFKNIHAIASYNSPNVKLHLTTDDAAAKLQGDFSTQLAGTKPWTSKPNDLLFDVNIDRLSPSMLHLTNRFGQGTIAMKAAGALNSLDINNLQANVAVENFTLAGDNNHATPFHVSNLDIQTQPIASGSHIRLRSDFADIDYSGPIHPQELKRIATNIYNNVQQGVFNEAKSAVNISKGNTPQSAFSDKRVNFIFALKDAEFLNRVFGLKANYNGTIQAQGSASDDGNDLSIACTAPTLSFGKFSVSDLSLYVRSDDGSFNILGKGRKALKNGDVKVELTAINRDGRIYTDIEWGENVRNAFYGKLSAIAKIDMPSNLSNSAAEQPVTDVIGSAIPEPSAPKSKFGITVDFTPSQVCIGDSLWQFSKSKIDYHNNRINIDNFGIHNATQSLAINGTYDRSFEDAINVDLHNIDLDYVLAFVHMNVVEFSGHATGKIAVKALPNGNPWAKAEVNVPDLQFNHTPFGNADVVLSWDHEAKDIVIDGHVTESGIGYTNVKGYVDPINRDLDLRTEGVNTQLGFLNKYTEGIFSNISGRASGHCRIYGGFQTIEFSGHEYADCEATIPVTGVSYEVKGADVDIIPDAFIVKSATIEDKFSGEGRATGLLTHTHIKDMNYDFELEGENLRLYDKPRELDMPFYATATGSGNVHIHGKPGSLNAEMHIKTKPGSELTYILDSPDADVSQLITFHDITSADSDTISLLLPIIAAEDDAPKAQVYDVVQTIDIPSPAAPTTTDINLQFFVDVDDNSCLHLITDDKSGDVITVYGSGPIQATYHNKSGFQMYGIYNIERGSYNLNIPSLAQRKKFEILSGGQVNFSGDPANADVKVKAQYVVSSASLADLNIGKGFANNTTRVNCLANIYGEVANMQFDLGLELPNCSQDEQQMVNNLIASDEDRTMQVMYLLGVGRFYAYNWNATDIAQSQSVLMMNSLLSSTLSSQLNNIISDAIGSKNWSFGTNISTGQMGWSDMEVEGLVSSRLLNNRLIINGNFGYSERQAATSNFVGDFDMQYLFNRKGTIRGKAYSETNDRYFTKSTLTTQGAGFQFKKDFTHLRELFGIKRSKKKAKKDR